MTLAFSCLTEDNGTELNSKIQLSVKIKLWTMRFFILILQFSSGLMD
jgi:hypothetical protein